MAPPAFPDLFFPWSSQTFCFSSGIPIFCWLPVFTVTITCLDRQAVRFQSVAPISLSILLVLREGICEVPDTWSQSVFGRKATAHVPGPMWAPEVIESGRTINSAFGQSF